MDEPFLIVDCVGQTLDLLTESTTNKCSANSGSVKFKGKFQEAETVNKNKRRYARPILTTEVERLTEAVAARGLVGELDHPTDSVIHFENASHLITKLWWEGNILMGEGEILPTPAGNILENLIRSKVRVGISSRGVGTGSVDKEGIMNIADGFKLITFDVVSDPSTEKAFPEVVTNKSRNDEVRKETKETTVSESKALDPRLLKLFLTKIIEKRALTN